MQGYDGIEADGVAAGDGLEGLRAAERGGERAAAGLASLLAFALGVVLIWGVGFSHLETVHNAAHDLRHSNAFPCH